MTDFHALYRHGFARVAACTLPVALADPQANVARTVQQAGACDADGVAVAVFPELGLCGYAIEDLRQQDVVLERVDAAVAELAAAPAGRLAGVVGWAPVSGWVIHLSPHPGRGGLPIGRPGPRGVGGGGGAGAGASRGGAHGRAVAGAGGGCAVMSWGRTV
ncbi:hypothetical protein [Novacetimonas hansenii]|uniref:hypothetical protein n=1 Tax=Novacetimonas hansenii TaxID=436 RepID=UPI0039EBD174